MNNEKMKRPPQASGYSEAGASHRKRNLKAFVPNSNAPNEDINWNNMTMRQRGRLLYMSSSVATSAIDTNRTKVVGTGLTLKSAANREVLGMSPEAAKDWERKAEAEFRLWASQKNSCDATGMNNFDGMQQLALKSWLMSGDVFAVFKRYDSTKINPYSLRIHLVEADRIRTPDEHGGMTIAGITDGISKQNNHKIYDGVEVDKNGRVAAYYVHNTYPLQHTNEPVTYARVPAYGKKTGLPNILHIMDSERPDQYRGVSYLAKAIEPLLQLRRYTESELAAALVQSYFTAWIKTTTNLSDVPINEVGAGDIAGVPTGNPLDDDMSYSPHEYEMGPGTVLHLDESEEVHFGNPNIPTAGFESFMKTMCKLVGASLELPYDVLIKEFNSSYSAARGALLEAWEAFKTRRKWFVDDFCQPVYEVWMAEAVARGRIKAPGFFDDPLIRSAWCGARWIGPVQGQLDPFKEAKAAILLVDRGFKTHEQVTRELGGGNWQENVEQLARENELLIDAGGKQVVVPGDASDDESENEDSGSKTD